MKATLSAATMLNALEERIISAARSSGDLCVQQVLANLPLSSRSEAWRYVELSKIRELPSDLSSSDSVQSFSLASNFPPNIRLIDGLLQTASDAGALKIATDCASTEDLTGLPDDEPLAYGATLLAENIITMNLPEGATIDHIHLEDSISRTGILCQAMKIVLAPNSSMEMTISQSGCCGWSYLRNALVILKVSAGARLQLNVLQQDSSAALSFSHVCAKLDRAAELKINHFAVGGGTGRMSLLTELNGSEASCTLNGLTVGEQARRIHNRLQVRHNAPQTRSVQHFKSILRDTSRSEFTGSIYVNRNCEGVDARQLNNNLLLSPLVKAFARPQLEIETDDIRCSHGATVSQIAPEQLFYLLSRGLSKSQSVQALTDGFAEQLIGEVSQEQVKFYLRGLIASGVA